jgi:osmotically-inducible protein OsmY
MKAVERRPDVDIEEDIEQLLRTFAPLKASRSYFTVRSKGGVVRLAGNVRGPQAKRVLLDNIPNMPGVKAVEAAELFDDETIRFAVGQITPPGLVATVHYGAVALTGYLEGEADLEEIVDRISALPGVRRVVTKTSRRDEA